MIWYDAAQNKVQRAQLRQTLGSFSPAEIRCWQQRKVTKGHLKVKLVAGNWPLILVAIETMDGFEGLVTEIRDDNLPGMFESWRKYILNTYTLWSLRRAFCFSLFFFYKRVKHDNATVLNQTNNFAFKSDDLKLSTGQTREVFPFSFHLHLSITVAVSWIKTRNTILFLDISNMPVACSN